MKKIVILTFSIFYTAIFFGQQIITNEITQNHREIRGTKIKMIPPEGFLVASNFKGFQESESNASIMILDVPRPFLETRKGLTAESLLRQSVKVKSIEEIIFNTSPAMFIEAEQSIDNVLFKKYIFVIGTDKETILISGLAPMNNIILNNVIKEAIRSTVYEPEKIIMPLDAVDFEINSEDSGFNLAKISPNMLIYNRDGKIPTESNDKTSFVVAKTFSKLEIGDKKSFALNKIKTLPIQISTVTSIVPIAIDELKGYELFANGINRKTGKSEQVYQVILFNNDGYYILYGSTEDQLNGNLAAFKKIALTFKLK